MRVIDAALLYMEHAGDLGAQRSCNSVTIPFQELDAMLRRSQESKRALLEEALACVRRLEKAIVSEGTLLAEIEKIRSELSEMTKGETVELPSTRSETMCQDVNCLSETSACTKPQESMC